MPGEEKKRIDRIQYDPTILKALNSNNAIPEVPGGTPGSEIPKLHKDSVSGLQTLRTFESDTAELIERQNQSTFSIQQAEEARKRAAATTVQGAAAEQRKEVVRDPSSRNNLMLLLSALFILIGTGSVLYFLVLKDKQASFLPPPQIESLYASQYETVIEDPNDSKGVLKEKIAAVVQGEVHEVGAVEHIKIIERGGEEMINADELLLEIAEDIPPALLRSLIKDAYMIGTIQHEEKEPFIIFKIELYENAFSNMLNFEPALANIFNDIVPSPAPVTPVTVQTTQATTSTSTGSIALSGSSTTPQAQTSAPTVPIPSETRNIIPPTLTDEFRDALVKNRDVRLIRDIDGNAKVLYSFYDEQTLVITTNESTFSDILNILKNDKLSR